MSIGINGSTSIDQYWYSRTVNFSIRVQIHGTIRNSTNNSILPSLLFSLRGISTGFGIFAPPLLGTNNNHKNTTSLYVSKIFPSPNPTWKHIENPMEDRVVL